MSEVMENRKHPDIFTAEEAAEYLHLPKESAEATLETLRSEYGLVGFFIGRKKMYHRQNLDELVARKFGTAEKSGTRKKA